MYKHAACVKQSSRKRNCTQEGFLRFEILIPNYFLKGQEAEIYPKNLFGYFFLADQKERANFTIHF